jgi:hypothetical protein
MRTLRKLEDITGFRLQATDGEIGKLLQVYFDDHYWVVRYFVVRTGNWLLGREVLIVPTALKEVAQSTMAFIKVRNITCSIRQGAYVFT